MGNVTQYRYDGVGNVVEVIDPLGNSIHYYYDGLNRLVRVNAEWSNPITGASGFQQTIYQFNGRGLLVTEINALGAQRTHEYDAAGNAVITVDEDGNVIRREFNPLNLVSAVTATSSNSNSNAENVRLGFVYDKTGRLVSMTDATGETNFLLDPLYRIIEVQDSFGRVTAYEHDPVGNLLSITHPDNSVVTYTHNRNNQVMTITDPDGGETRNVYDSYGRLTRQYHPNGGRTEFAYNSLNQLTQQREIFNGRTTRQFIYGYTDNGLLHNETIQFFGLDNVDTTRLFRYDANGQMISSTDTLLGRADLEYDSMGNLIRESRAGAVTTFTHNAMNQLLTRTGPDGHFTYTYDQRGNLISESRNGIPIRTFEYDTLGRMMKGTNALGETSEYMYNALGLRVANVQRILPGHMGGHGWDVNGYLTDTPNSPGSHYIDVNRMALAGLPTAVWLDGFASTDGLDSSVLLGSTNSAGSTGGMNNIDRYLWQGELPDDIPGRMGEQFAERTTSPEGAHQRIFKDNFGLNRNSGVVRQEFVIDYVMGFNQDLMLVEEGGFSTVFVYGTPLQRLSQHTSRADSIVSGVAAVGGALDPGGNVAADIAVLPVYAVLYYRLDFRNSTSQMQLPNGQYIAWTGYNEWGATTSPTDHDMNMAGVDPIQFGSYNFDRILGLYYAQRRFYDPHARRFTQPDPKWHTGISGGNSIWGDNPTRMPNAGFLPDIYAIYQSTNLYAYVMNDPINFIDPTGLSAAAACFGGGNSTVKGPSLPPLPAHVAQRAPTNNPAPRVTPAHNPPPLQNAVLQDTVGTPTEYSEPFGCEQVTNFMGESPIGASNFVIAMAFPLHPHIPHPDAVGIANDPVMLFLWDGFMRGVDWSRVLIGDVVSSTTVEGSLGFGLGSRYSLGPFRGEILATARQTYTISTDEFTQRTHAGLNIGADAWRDQIGLTVIDLSYGWTYSSTDGGFTIVDGRVVPSFEWMTGIYAGDTYFVLGNVNRGSDWSVGIGMAKYAGVGGDFDISFNITEFRQLRNQR